MLESVLRDDVHDATYLYEAAMWFETLYRYDRNMTTANVKNMGLAHVHLVRSTKGKAPPPTVPDILGNSGLLHDEQQSFAGVASPSNNCGLEDLVLVSLPGRLGRLLVETEAVREGPPVRDDLGRVRQGHDGVADHGMGTTRCLQTVVRRSVCLRFLWLPQCHCYAERDATLA